MKLPILDLHKKEKGQKELPSQFKEAYRPDLIKRAVHALQSSARQRYGAFPDAGKRSSSETSKRRRNYRGTYGFGISRVKRKIHSRRGTRMFWVGAYTPQTVGGRRAHPPKAEKNLEKLINVKEKRKAIRSAISATVNKEIVSLRGHKLPPNYPFIADSSLEKINQTKEMKQVLLDLGFKDELQRSLIKKIRAGLGTMRGRKYQRKKGILVVVSEDCPAMKSLSNLSGIDVVAVTALNAELLAPGANPGRVTIWTEKAVDKLADKKLFI
ncbi:MAG TPA: 50S ribosomal protein L4 [Candidatus Nanoarchaeia archaeon]|nr:50S ribosomal protein L4 [Candidatus Nanoarchaeia archaeon]